MASPGSVLIIILTVFYIQGTSYYVMTYHAHHLKKKVLRKGSLYNDV